MKTFKSEFDHKLEYDLQRHFKVKRNLFEWESIFLILKTQITENFTSERDLDFEYDVQGQTVY